MVFLALFKDMNQPREMDPTAIRRETALCKVEQRMRLEDIVVDFGGVQTVASETVVAVTGGLGLQTVQLNFG
jgi:hypothetical protein